MCPSFLERFDISAVGSGRKDWLPPCTHKLPVQKVYNSKAHLKASRKFLCYLTGIHRINTQPLDSRGYRSGIDSIPLVQRPRADQGIQPDWARGRTRGQTPAHPFDGVPCCAGAVCR